MAKGHLDRKTARDARWERLCGDTWQGQPSGNALHAQDCRATPLEAKAILDLVWANIGYFGDPYYKPMTEACGGDEIMGSLLSLFSHRRNDVESLAPYYGIALDRDEAGKLYIRDDIPPPPSLRHWWHEGEWTAPLDRETEEVAKP